MTAIFPGWTVVKQRTVNGAVMVLLWRLAAESNDFCLVRHDWRGAKGGWRYRSRWSAEYALDDWDGKGAPIAGEWKDFEARP